MCECLKYLELASKINADLDVNQDFLSILLTNFDCHSKCFLVSMHVRAIQVIYSPSCDAKLHVIGPGIALQ